METFFEDHLVVINAGEFEKDASGCLGQREAAFELHLLADGRSFLHAEAVGRSEEEGAFGQEMFGVRDIGLTLSALHQSMDLFLPHVRV